MKAAIVLAACLGFVASGAAAGTINLRIETSAEIRDDQLVVVVGLSNSGDEAAIALTPDLHFRGEAVQGTRVPSLPPGGSVEQTLVLPAGGPGAGRWPFQLGLSYTDTNQYPFEALHAATVEMGTPPPARVAVVRFEPVSVSGTGDLEVQLKNLSEVPRSVRLGVLVPGVLEAAEPADEIALEAWEERPVTVQLTNRTALAGSSYPVFVALEYDDGPVHQTLLARSEVAVVEEEARPSRFGRLLWIGAAVFGLLFLGLLIFRP
jgi:hypothetical protein